MDLKANDSFILRHRSEALAPILNFDLGCAAPNSRRHFRDFRPRGDRMENGSAAVKILVRGEFRGLLRLYTSIPCGQITTKTATKKAFFMNADLALYYAKTSRTRELQSTILSKIPMKKDQVPFLQMRLQNPQ